MSQYRQGLEFVDLQYQRITTSLAVTVNTVQYSSVMSYCVFYLNEYNPLSEAYMGKALV